MSTVLVIGARGMLGQEIVARLAATDASTRVVTPTREQFDLAECDGLEGKLDAIRPDRVFNCAAMVQVDACETRYDEALRINAESPGRLAAWCAGHDAKLVHVSTDYVFDGACSTPIPETHPTHPVNRYGASKLEGEKRIGAASDDALIVRTAWLFAASGRNFFRFVVDGLQAGRSVPVVNDQIGSPTYAADAAAGILDLFDADARGVFHIVNAGACTWAEFATYLQRQGRLGGELKPVPGESLSRSARRPPYTALSTDLFTRTVKRGMRPWTEAADACLQAWRWGVQPHVGVLD